ncbi:hypothetical protein JL722_1929 [Aureococcus anophagefferens]|nr:hypothetical protein JL722_1929 [Aureococcus anophagefferens]
MRAAPEPPSGDGRGPRAVYAVRRLLPDHVRAPSIKMRATSMGGSNGQTYRVDVPEQRSNGESVQESYFVRVLPAGYEANAWNRRFAESCVANTVAASDAGVTAAVLAADETALVQQFIPSARVETTAWRAGRETGATWRNTLEDHADARRFGAMVAAIHAVPYPDPSAPLAPHCFYCWYDMPEWSFAAKPYPCFAARQAVARAYLAASGLPASRDDVCELLYAVEYCVGDEDLRDAIIEQGVLALAAAGHAPGDDDAGLFGHCSTPCACS